MSKRNNDVPGPSGQPPAKKLHFEPMVLGTISSLEEMEVKTLRFQNRKLAQRLQQRDRIESSLRSRIEQLEKRQTQDDSVLNVINRYWNQLNEDIRLMLLRFDGETSDELESKNESDTVTSFLTQLSSWDKDELDQQLASRVQTSKRAVGKILQVFDRLLQRNQKLGESLKTTTNSDELIQVNVTLREENKRIQDLTTTLQEKHHKMSLNLAKMQESQLAKETEIAELQNRVDDLEYETNKSIQHREKLEVSLSEAMEKVKDLQQVTANVDTDKADTNQGGAPVSNKKVEELQHNLEEQTELSTCRLQELEKLQNQHRDTLKCVEQLKLDIRQLPESVIVETTEYKCLQSQFSVLYNESMQLRTQLEETRNLLNTSKNTHLRQIEQMESEELMSQKKLRTEVIQLEDMLAQVRKEYEMLRIEFEQNLAANEQTGPINREMRHLITSLQNHNHQFKVEVQRYKRRYKECQTDLNKCRKDLEAAQTVKLEKIEAEEAAADAAIKEEARDNQTLKEEPGTSHIKDDPDYDDDFDSFEGKLDYKKEDGMGGKRDLKSMEMEIRELKAQLKKCGCDQKEMKLLLDMYKGVAKDQRDKVQLMAAEKRAKLHIDELKKELKNIQENKREEKRSMANEEAVKKIQVMQDQHFNLQKIVAAQKQEEEALLSEMEVTGQAFEDMQEQNIRLIQQLREKDDANFKLMSERIKSNQIHKVYREQKDMLLEQVSTLTTQVEAQNQVVRKLEEKERLSQAAVNAVEKELALRTQALEMHKRKAIESAQSSADLKLHLDKYHSQMKESQQIVADKTASLEQEAYKTRRYQEEIASLKKKIERAKKFEVANTADEVLLAEIQEYKEQLTCPSCKVKKKDAVLTKCFHVFCFDCLRTRYETRQRKCPKCNAAFGANDYHRLYLS